MQIRPTAFTIGLIIHFSIALFCVYTEFGIDSQIVTSTTSTTTTTKTIIPTVNRNPPHNHGQYSTYIETIYKESKDSVLDLPKIKYTRAYDVYICNICGGVCAVKFNQSQSNDGNTLLC